MYPIASTTLSSNGQVSFTGIPATFTHLQIRCTARSADSGTTSRQIYVYFNGDGASNYAGHYIYGDGANVPGGNALTVTYGAVAAIPAAGNLANVYAGVVIDIVDYANTSKNKTLKSIAGVDFNGSGAVSFSSGHWRNTAAINRVDVNTEGSFLAGSRFDLYGISTSTETGA
jgi:hypothetical protein